MASLKQDTSNRGFKPKLSTSEENKGQTGPQAACGYCGCKKPLWSGQGTYPILVVLTFVSELALMMDHFTRKDLNSSRERCGGAGLLLLARSQESGEGN